MSITSVSVSLPSQDYTYTTSREQLTLASQEVETELRRQALSEELFVVIQDAQNLAAIDGKQSILSRTESAVAELEPVFKFILEQIKLPEFGILPDGGVGVEWFGNAQKRIALSSNGTRKLVFSGWFGGVSHQRGYLNPEDRRDLSLLIDMVKRVVDE